MVPETPATYPWSPPYYKTFLFVVVEVSQRWRFLSFVRGLSFHGLEDASSTTRRQANISLNRADCAFSQQKRKTQ
jgi:hypothetical protein